LRAPCIAEVSLTRNSRRDSPLQDKKGVRPMFLAAAHGHTEVVELMCDHGVDPNDDDSLVRHVWHIVPDTLSRAL